MEINGNGGYNYYKTNKNRPNIQFLIVYLFVKADKATKNNTVKSYKAKVYLNKLTAGYQYNSMYCTISIHLCRKYLNEYLPFVAIVFCNIFI